MLAVVLFKPIPIQWSHWTLYRSNKLFTLSNIFAAVGASLPSGKFMSKNFFIIWLKLTSNIRTVTGNIFCKPVVTPIQYNIKRGLGHSFFQFIREVISDAVGNSSCFLLQVKFLAARLVEIFFLIKGAKWSIILRNVLCCTTSITDLTAAVMPGSPDTDPTLYFFANTFAYFLIKGEKFSKQNGCKHIHVQFINSC